MLRPLQPFLRGLLEFYGLQLHHLTPASILHIAGFIALCELFLGIEPHFALWKRLFFLVPRSHEGSIYQVGRAEIWRITGTGYLSGTPKKASEDWPAEPGVFEERLFKPSAAPPSAGLASPREELP